MTVRFFATLCTGLLLTGVVNGGVYVAPNGPGPAPFDSWATAASDIQTAVTAASSGDTILISNGVYTLTSTISVAKNLTLRGVPASTQPTIDGNQLVRCLKAEQGTTVFLENLKIIKGVDAGLKGAGASLVNGGVRDCVFSNNVATSHGGGLYITGSGTVERTTFMYNVSEYGGGGLASYRSPFLRIDDCLFQKNYAKAAGGGGLSLDGVAGLALVNSRVLDNVTTNLGSGGGIYAISTPVSETPNLISNCVIAGNIAGSTNETGNGFHGGGIHMRSVGNSYTIANCIITNNAAAKHGGGISLCAPSMVRNCLIAYNRQTPGVGNAYYGGGGVYIEQNGQLINCRVKGNSTIYGGGGVFSPSSSLIRNCLITDNVAMNPANGGGIRNRFAGLTVENCTITRNVSGGYGGGLDIREKATFSNCIIFSNECSSSDSFQNYYIAGAGAKETAFLNCCFTPELHSDYANYSFSNIHVDPRFEGEDYILRPSSPCINTGTNLLWMTGALDLANCPRIDRGSGKVDMGCFEYVPIGTVIQIQ